MTTDRLIVPDLDPDEQDILNALVGQLALKAPRNKLRSAYYDGRNAVRDLGISTPPTVRRLAMVLGWSAKAVDILNDRCNLDDFTVPGGADLTSVGLPDLLERNYFDTELPQAQTSALVHSVSFAIATQGDASTGEPPGLITFKDALTGTGMWDRRRRSLSSFLSVINRNDDGQITEFVLYLPNLNITAVNDGGWTVERRDHVYGVPVEPLPFRPRLSRPFGGSRISRVVMALQDAATRTMVRSEVSAEFYSAPQRVLLGADESAFKNPDGTVKTAWQAILGRIWAIPDDAEADNPRADIKEFTAASQQPHVDQLRAQAQQFAGETSIPIASLGLGASEVNPTSAEAYYASREDLIRLAEATTDGWTPGIRRTVLRALQMANGWTEVPPEFADLKPKWRSPVTVSRAAAADAGMKIITTFPWMAQSELGLELFGFDQAFIDRAKGELRKQRGSAVLDALRGATPPVTNASFGNPAP